MEIKTIKKITGITLVGLTVLAMSAQSLTPQAIEDHTIHAEAAKAATQDNKEEEKLPESKTEPEKKVLEDFFQLLNAAPSANL